MQYRLEDALKYEQPSKYIVQSEEYSTDISLVPVLTAGKTFILGYTEENQGICKASSAPVILFDDFTADSRYIDFDFKVKSSAVKILHKMNTEDNLKYFYYAMQAIKYKPFSHKRVWISEYSKFTVKQRTPNEQNTIVAMLDKLENAIKNAKQRLIELDELVKSRFIEMFGDVKNNDKNFFVKKGTDLFKFSSGKFLEATKRLESGIPVYGGNGIAWYTSEPLINFDTIVIGRVGAYCGNVRKISGSNWITDNAIYIKEFKEKCFNLEFLEALMGEYDFAQFNDAAAQPKITQKPMENLYYIVPPIELQNTFAEFVKQVDKSKFIVQKQIDDLQELLDSKMDEYFG
mgnify:CR=1 FL=1